jgi:hypothetical protein
MYKHLLLLTALVVASLGARANEASRVVNISCSTKIFKQELNHTVEVEKTFIKTLKAKTKLFNNKIEKIKFSETIRMSDEYSIRIDYDEETNLETLLSETKVDGTLFRDRVGNGKIVLGESKTIKEDMHYFASAVEVEIMNSRDLGQILGFVGYSKVNSFEQAVNYGLLVKGVVKSAFVKCKTL